MKILVTSGGTKVPIDRVRSIRNMSKGTFGARIAAEALKAGHHVLFLRAKDSKSPFTPDIDLNQPSIKWHTSLAEALSLKAFVDRQLCNPYTEFRYSTFEDYEDALATLLDDHQPDVTILAAAVSDYGVEDYVDGKVRSGDALSIKMKPLPKLIGRVKEWCPTTKLVGFKLLVGSTDEELIAAAKKSVLENQCDIVVANDLRDIQNNSHRLILVSRTPGNYDIWDIEYVYTDLNDPNHLAKEVIKRAVTL